MMRGELKIAVRGGRSMERNAQRIKLKIQKSKIKILESLRENFIY